MNGNENARKKLSGKHRVALEVVMKGNKKAANLRNEKY
jgi:hypothetical protein